MGINLPMTRGREGERGPIGGGKSINCGRTFIGGRIFGGREGQKYFCLAVASPEADRAM